MSLSLSLIAHNLGGRVQGNKVVAPGPEAAGHKVKWKRKRKSVTVYIGQDNDIRVNCHAAKTPLWSKIVSAAAPVFQIGPRLREGPDPSRPYGNAISISAKTCALPETASPSAFGNSCYSSTT
jgi:hypothetical protein